LRARIGRSGDAGGCRVITQTKNRLRGADRCSTVGDRIQGLLRTGNFRIGDESVTSSVWAKVTVGMNLE